MVNLVQRHPVDELVTELKRRKTISKEQVLRESMHSCTLIDLLERSKLSNLSEE